MNWQFNRIAVVGLGYIGLPTAAMFASRKIHVIGIDVSEHAVETINQGKVHIVEPDLDIAVHSAVSQGYLRATTKPEPADAFLIAVPTPFKGDDHDPDLSYIEAACRSIAPVLAQGNLVVLESTSPVGTTEKMSAWLAEARPDLSFPQQSGEASDVRVAHCPERVLPGKVMQELIQNDRVIGGITSACSDAALSLYSLFVKGECVVTDARTAEMAKLTENAFRDVNIAFANELSLICDRLDINVWELIALANRHPRVNILQPGPGVGGHCIAVDPWFIVSSAPDISRLIRATREVNDGKPGWVLQKVEAAVAQWSTRSGSSASEVTIACYGLAFKPDIDDLRESPALYIAEQLQERFGERLVVIEPNIEGLPVSLDRCQFGSTPDIAADIHVLLVDHREFKAMAVPEGLIVDTRGVWTGVRGAA
ncbi:UDP-N-acetyl-D-mannosamine dehydrogenase [Sphingopyxis sp. R3-92]|uniref:UDP-N-acetyl-D-mannosamine dehydrogenase n=1 Tax=Sphingopyxis sp. R3-92 TaxID=3158553 RepID=UPI003EE7F6E7